MLHFSLKLKKKLSKEVLTLKEMVWKKSYSENRKYFILETDITKCFKLFCFYMPKLKHLLIAVCAKWSSVPLHLFQVTQLFLYSHQSKCVLRVCITAELPAVNAQRISWDASLYRTVIPTNPPQKPGKKPARKKKSQFYFLTEKKNPIITFTDINHF